MNEIQRAESGFAQIKNEVLFNPELSLKAKGLFAYIYAKPSGWQFSGDRVARETKEGRYSVYSALKELEECGYLVRERQGDGRVIYRLSYEPHAKNQHDPVAENRQEQKPSRAETVSISNTDSYIEIQKEHSNTELATHSVALKRVLTAFRDRLNPTLNFANKTQRGATEFLLKQIGEEKILKAIDYCASIQGDRYAPIITTPYQLKEKWAQLATYHKKQVNNTTVFIS